MDNKRMLRTKSVRVQNVLSLSRNIEETAMDFTSQGKAKDALSRLESAVKIARLCDPDICVPLTSEDLHEIEVEISKIRDDNPRNADVIAAYFKNFLRTRKRLGENS